MIVVGTYADGFISEDSGVSGLQTLTSVTRQMLPPNIGLHILPIGPTSGDSGFACDDWFAVRPPIGTWDQVRTLASQRRLIIDGIYNHVGLGHKFARAFWNSPDNNSRLIHAFTSDDELEFPRSPRGGCALRGHVINNQRWLVWQTFSEYALDIQLDSEEVQREIDRHLEFLSGLHVWGLRLDGPAYFGKQINIPNHRHHPDAYRLARQIADKALRHGFVVNAQLDCDESGLKYFPSSMGYDIPIVDYSYSAYLIHALLESDIEAFVAHLQATWQMPQTLIRCPRTFDGILLRSKNLKESVIDDLARIAQTYRLPLRVIDGSPYEINSSFPFVCSLGVPADQTQDRIALSIAVTGFLPGWCYIYFPILFGYIPEHNDGNIGVSDDPRFLNRSAVPASVQHDFLSSEKSEEVTAMMQVLAQLITDVEDHEDFSDDSVTSFDGIVLCIRREHIGLLLLANFSSERSVNVDNQISSDCLYSRRFHDGLLEPLGFGIWHYNGTARA